MENRFLVYIIFYNFLNFCSGRDGPTVESHQARGPCPECGAMSVNVWKGGGYNMGNKVEAAAPNKAEARKDDNTQDNYIKSLQQQIKILELEIAYLKKQIQVQSLQIQIVKS